MQYAVPNRSNFRHGRNDAMLFAGQCIDHQFNGCAVVRDVSVEFVFAFAGFLLEYAAVNTNALTAPFCENRLVGHINELVFEGGTACVDYQYLHVS